MKYTETAITYNNVPILILLEICNYLLHFLKLIESEFCVEKKLIGKIYHTLLCSDSQNVSNFFEICWERFLKILKFQRVFSKMSRYIWKFQKIMVKTLFFHEMWNNLQQFGRRFFKIFLECSRNLSSEQKSCKT